MQQNCLNSSTSFPFHFNPEPIDYQKSPSDSGTTRVAPFNMNKSQRTDKDKIMKSNYHFPCFPFSSTNKRKKKT